MFFIPRTARVLEKVLARVDCQVHSFDNLSSCLLCQQTKHIQNLIYFEEKSSTLSRKANTVININIVGNVLSAMLLARLW